MNIVDFKDLQKTYAFFFHKKLDGVCAFVTIMILSLIGLGLWLALGSLDDTVSADTLLRPKDTISSVRVQYSGKIKEKKYENNQFVEKGDILLVLDTTSIEKELEKAKENLKQNEINSRVDKVLLETMRTGAVSVDEWQTEEYFRSAAYISELSRLTKEMEEAKTQYEREKTKPDMFTTVQTIEDYKNTYEIREKVLEAFVHDSKYQVTSALENLETEREVLLKDIENLENEISLASVKAPVTGRIKETRKINIGESLFSSEEVLQIVPENTEKLKAEIYVKTADIARIKNDNRVRIKLSGLSPARYGYVEAKVSLVPPDYQLMSSGTPAFIVEADIDNTVLSTRSGEKVQLKSGLSGKAKVVVGHEKAYVMLLRKLDFIW